MRYMESRIQDQLFMLSSSFQKGGKVSALASEVIPTLLPAMKQKTYSLFTSRANSMGTRFPTHSSSNIDCLSAKDIIKAEPSLPSNMGSALLTNRHQNRSWGDRKWRASSGNRVESIFVHNQEGQFSVSSAIALGKKLGKNQCGSSIQRG